MPRAGTGNGAGERQQHRVGGSSRDAGCWRRRRRKKKKHNNAAVAVADDMRPCPSSREEEVENYGKGS